VSWQRQSPDREIKELSPWGWLFYRRVKTGKTFWRPMNHTGRLRLKSILPEMPNPDAPVFVGGDQRRAAFASAATRGWAAPTYADSVAIEPTTMSGFAFTNSSSDP
jgi:hypothetical protein